MRTATTISFAKLPPPSRTYSGTNAKRGSLFTIRFALTEFHSSSLVAFGVGLVGVTLLGGAFVSIRWSKNENTCPGFGGAGEGGLVDGSLVNGSLARFMFGPARR